MRKIISKEKIEKKRKRNQFILGGFLVLVMMGSVFGVIVSSFGNNSKTQGNLIKVNGINFIDYQGRWIYQDSEDSFFSFRNLPNETGIGLGEVNSLKNIKEYSGKVFYFYSEDNIVKMQLRENFAQLVLRIQEACPENSSNETIEYCIEKDLPIKDCSNNFVIVREDNESRIFTENNCVFIQGDKKDLNRLTDEFIYQTVGLK